MLFNFKRPKQFQHSTHLSTYVIIIQSPASIHLKHASGNFDTCFLDTSHFTLSLETFLLRNFPTSPHPHPFRITQHQIHAIPHTRIISFKQHCIAINCLSIEPSEETIPSFNPAATFRSHINLPRSEWNVIADEAILLLPFLPSFYFGPFSTTRALRCSCFAEDRGPKTSILFRFALASSM